MKNPIFIASSNMAEQILTEILSPFMFLAHFLPYVKNVLQLLVIVCLPHIDFTFPFVGLDISQHFIHGPNSKLPPHKQRVDGLIARCDTIL